MYETDTIHPVDVDVCCCVTVEHTQTLPLKASIKYLSFEQTNKPTTFPIKQHPRHTNRRAPPPRVVQAVV